MPSNRSIAQVTGNMQNAPNVGLMQNALPAGTVEAREAGILMKTYR